MTGTHLDTLKPIAEALKTAMEEQAETTPCERMQAWMRAARVKPMRWKWQGEGGIESLQPDGWEPPPPFTYAHAVQSSRG
jgi:hypothetical protein